MPVDRGFNIQRILDENLDIIPLIDVNQRSWLLTIYEVHLTLESVYSVISVAAPKCLTVCKEVRLRDVDTCLVNWKRCEG